MEKITVDGMFAVKNNGDGVLGKMVIFSLPNVLIVRDKLIQICENLNLPVTVGARFSDRDAFRSATSDIYDRIEDQKNGNPRVRKIYCRDNGKSENVVSRELVCETLGQTTNGYKKLANFCFRKDTDSFDCTIEDHGSSLNIAGYCDKARRQFELYKTCIGRNQFENLIDSYLEKMEVLKMNVHGKVYFIPKKNIQMVDTFEDFIESINVNNIRNGEINVYSLFVADNTKHRGKIANEFYYNARQEIKNYMTRFETLIASNSSNPALLERWANKADLLQNKKREYELLLRSELGELDDDYQTLCFLSDELRLRANKLRQAN